MTIVMRHEARQVPSWLIFDVRQMKAPQRRILKLSLAIAAIVGGFWLSGVRLCAFSGRSMEPTVRAGDYFVGLVGLWGASQPKRFDMVIFDVAPTSKWAGRGIPWVKRLVGLPGERVRLAGDRLFIDGGEERALFLRRDREATALNDDFEIRLKAEEYFVLGDNLDHTVEDSRVLGPIPSKLLKGRVAFVLNRSNPQSPNKAPEPTTTAVTPRAP